MTKNNHMENLAVIFGLKPEFMKAIYKNLESCDKAGHKLSELYCNGDIDEELFSKKLKRIKNNVYATLAYAKPTSVNAIIFNTDPRGYFLKLDDNFCRDKKIETDWGGYGIICK